MYPSIPARVDYDLTDQEGIVRKLKLPRDPIRIWADRKRELGFDKMRPEATQAFPHRLGQKPTQSTILESAASGRHLELCWRDFLNESRRLMSPLERNKATVQAFYDLMFNRCQPAEAIR
jgi:hypothetical protein